MNRDPRSTPIAGDTARSAGGRFRDVNCVHGDEVSYRAFTRIECNRPAKSTRNVCSMQAWRRWCAHEDCVVLAWGDDG